MQAIERIVGQAPERDNVQASIDAYMGDSNYSTLPVGEELDGPEDTSTNDFSALTGTLDLETGAFMRGDTTSYYYCWDSTGLILVQDVVATPDCTR